jgi:transcriptional regulator with PAS, ATPase and Fis domain
VAARDTTVLLRGETGSGKGLMARWIHNASQRRKQPFVELNCAGLQRDLTESELFGHEKGAFTGATDRKIGLFEAADGGTLFLDEIGEMDLSIQAKLLKVLEEKRFRRVGGLTEIEVDVRLIAATHRDLTKDVTDGKFREDLFYRLNIFAIQIPPLRDRREDVLPLARYFLAEFRGSEQSAEISSSAADMLHSYAWPGNVREVRNVIERAAILCPPTDPIQPAHLPRFSTVPKNEPAVASLAAGAVTMQQAEKSLLELALKEHDYNIKATAADLGISRGTLYRKVKKYNIPVEGNEDDEE